VKEHYHNFLAIQRNELIDNLLAEAEKLLKEGKEVEAKAKEHEADEIDLSVEEVEKVTESLLKNEETGPKNPKEIKDLISTFLSNGDHVAITTFNEFSGVIKPTLRQIGLKEEQIEKIHIIAFLPEDQDQGKGEHIRAAMEKVGMQNKTQVYLIDDSKHNCDKAKEEGYKSILVDDTDNYLDNLQEVCILEVETEVTMNTIGEFC